MNNENNEGFKITALEIEHFKNIDRKVVTIGGKSFVVVGKNGAGKSSIIQAIQSPLDRKNLPPEPVKKGEEKAKIAVKIGGRMRGEEKEYTLEMYFSQKNKKGTLKLYNDQKEEIKAPATFIDSLVGEISFDPMAWLHAKRDKKIEMLKRLTGREQEINNVNADISRKKEEQKYMNGRIEDLEAIVNKNDRFTKKERDLYMEPKSMEDIMQRQQEVIEKQRLYDDFHIKVQSIINQRNNVVENIKRSFQESADISKEIERLQHKLTQEQEKRDKLEIDRQEIEAKIQNGENWLAGHERPKLDEVTAEMNSIVEHNQRHQELMHLGNNQREMLDLKGKVDLTKASIQGLEKKRDEIIAQSQLPIEGLSFSDDEIFLNGLPLEEGQINTAQLINVGIEISMAMNPTLKCVFIREGSLLDNEMMRTIADKVEANNYQVIFEVVGQNEEAEIQFTEEFL